MVQFEGGVSVCAARSLQGFGGADGELYHLGILVKVEKERGLGSGFGGVEFFEILEYDESKFSGAKMPIIIKNEKGLYATSSIIRIGAVDFEAVKSAYGADEDCARWCAKFEGMMVKEGLYWGAKKYPESYWFTCPDVPSGFGNETQQWHKTESELRAWWREIGELRADFSKWSKKLAKKTDFASKSMDAVEKFIPKAANIAKWEGFFLESLDPGWEAKGGSAWAIWMGSARQQGYMDDKKRPAGASGARLFESEAAAMRTAKAAKFGSDRGPAAIVRMGVQCQEISHSEPGALCEAPKQQMALREARELQDYLEEASLDDIRMALGESPSERAPKAEAPVAGSLAGGEDGFACWVDVVGAESKRGGFLNIRNELGPLLGAALRPTLEAAKNKSAYWGAHTSVVRVSCAPLSIDAKIGEPQVASLAAAIDWESKVASEAALEKQGAQALRSRAKALESGEVAPRRKSRSL